LVTCVILSAGAMLIFSVLFQIDQMSALRRTCASPQLLRLRLPAITRLARGFPSPVPNGVCNHQLFKTSSANTTPYHIAVRQARSECASAHITATNNSTHVKCKFSSSRSATPSWRLNCDEAMLLMSHAEPATVLQYAIRPPSDSPTMQFCHHAQYNHPTAMHC
jgi:hypothetical protein